MITMKRWSWLVMSWQQRIVLCSLVAILILSTLAFAHLPMVHAAAQPDSTPLLLVHGFDDSCANAFQSTDAKNPGSNASTTDAFLASQGWTVSQLVHVGYYTSVNNVNESSCQFNVQNMTQGGTVKPCSTFSTNKDGSLDDPIRHLACLLSWYIYDNYSQLGKPVNILAHSMGGLVVRDALGEAGKTPGFASGGLNVRHVVTVGTPHGGEGGPYQALAIQQYGQVGEITDMIPGSNFMNTIAPLQAPRGTADATWALMGAFDSCMLNVSTGGHAVSCFAEAPPISYPDGDGVVNGASMLAMKADYKILYGQGLDVSGGMTMTADAATQYQHDDNSCGPVPGFGTQCLQPPFYLNDGTPDSQTTSAWICSSSCNATDLSDMNVFNGTAQPAYHSLAEIAWLLAPPNIAPVINTQDVMAISGSKHLVDYHWQINGTWSVTDVSAQAGVPNGGLWTTVNAHTVPFATVSPEQDAFVIGDVTGPPYGNNFHLYQYYRSVPSGAWHEQSIDTKFTFPANDTVNLTNPAAYSYMDVQKVTRHFAYIGMSDNHLHGFFWASNGTWTTADIGAVPGGVAALSAHTFTMGGVSFQDVYVLGGNGHLYEYYTNQTLPNASWGINDLTALVSLPAGLSIWGGPAAISYTTPVDGAVNHAVAFVTSDKHLRLYQWHNQGGSWGASDLGMLDGAGIGNGETPSISTAVVNGRQEVDIDVRNYNDQLFEVSQPYPGASWSTVNISATGGPVSGGLFNSVNGFIYRLPNQAAIRHSIYVETGSGHLEEYLYVQGTSATWSATDHGLAPGNDATHFFYSGPSITGYAH